MTRTTAKRIFRKKPTEFYNFMFQESKLINTETKDSTFTKKRTMFKEALEDTLSQRNVTRTRSVSLSQAIILFLYY